MSSLRDIRLLVARHLDQPPPVKAALLQFLLQFDLILDENGFDETPYPELAATMRRLEASLIDSDIDVLEDIAPSDALAQELVDIREIIDEEDEDDDDL